MYYKKIIIPFVFLLLMCTSTNYSQFIDEFDDNKIEGWFAMTGDGTPELQFVPHNGYATMIVDGSKDKHNVYWALIKRDITKWLDISLLDNPHFQLRVEAKVRLHNAPRRLNFMVNTNRTIDYHLNLMEYDIPDTNNWHVISMTTKRLDTQPGDTVYVQLAATDFGLGKYYVDIDYYRADIINVKEAGPDKGNLVQYHPPIPKLESFSNKINVSDDCTISSEFPDINFNDLHSKTENSNVSVLNINNNQWAILKWDFSKYNDAKISDIGVLELTTQSAVVGGNYISVYGEEFGMEFGKLRVIEILSGNPLWDQGSVTYNTLTEGKDYSEVFNTQMTYDFEINEESGGRNYITISNPVMQRLIDGTTKGLMIRPLGAISVTLYSSENPNKSLQPALYFNIENKQ